MVTDQDGIRHEIMAYTMNSPYKDTPAMPSKPIWKDPERLQAERDRNRPCFGSSPVHSEGTAEESCSAEKTPPPEKRRRTII